MKRLPITERIKCDNPNRLETARLFQKQGELVFGSVAVQYKHDGSVVTERRNRQPFLLRKVFKKCEDASLCKLQYKLKEDGGITLLRFSLQPRDDDFTFEDEADFDSVSQLDSIKRVFAFSQETRDGIRGYLAVSGYSQNHEMSIRYALSKVFANDGFYIKSVRATASLMMDLSKDSYDAFLTSNVFAFDDSSNTYKTKNFAIPILCSEKPNTTLPCIGDNEDIYEHSSHAEHFLNLVSIAAISSHVSGITVSDESQFDLKPINSLLVTSNRTSPNSVFNTVTCALNESQSSREKLAVEERAKQTFYESYLKIRKSESLNRVRAAVKQSMNKDDSIDAQAYQKYEKAFCAASIAEVTHYERRHYCVSSSCSKIQRAAFVNKDGMMVICSDATTLFKELRKESPTAVFTSDLLQGNSNQLMDKHIGHDQVTEQSYLSLFGAIDHNSFANFALAETTPSPIFNVEKPLFIVDFDVYASDKSFELDVHRLARTKIKHLEMCLDICAALKKHDIVVQADDSFTEDTPASSKYSDIMSLAFALEVLNKRNGEFDSAQKTFVISSNSIRLATLIVSDAYVQKTNMLERKRLIRSASAIKMVEKLKVQHLKDFSTRDICQFEWGGIGRKTPFVNEVLALLSDLGFLFRVESKREGNYRWAWNEFYTFDNALDMLKGSKY